MLNAETFLLQAVVEAVQAGLGLSAAQCNVEYEDDFVPQTAGDVYIAVAPGGVRSGQHHGSSGGVRDFVFGCRVTAFLRSRNTPRDSRRSLFMTQVTGLNSILDKIIQALDWKASVILRANELLRAVEPSAQGFQIGPLLRVDQIDSRPRTVVGDVYGAGSQGGKGADTYAGLSRGVTFGGARRMEYTT